VSMSPERLNPVNAADLLQPMFVAWFDDQLRGNFEPDRQEFSDPPILAMRDDECSVLYQTAQFRMIIRLYGVWKASQN
jgi:hypothetical protein